MTEQERRWLACCALGVSSARLLAHPELLEAHEAQALYRRREAGEPLQYILGEAPFWGRDFHVGPGVLIPRPDTEVLIEAALALIPRDEPPFTFLDWGTGSGCIAATLLLEFPQARALMVDKSETALEYAGQNLARYGLESQARLLRSEAPEDIAAQRCRLAVSNPPYIPSGKIPHLMREVRDHEPRLALDGGPDGLDCYRALLRNAPRWLEPGGLLLMEAGDAAQAEALRSLGGLTFAREFRRHENEPLLPSCVAWRAG